MEQHRFHTLEGKGIRFQEVKIEHVEQIHAYASDEEVSKYIGWKLMNSIADTRGLIEGMLLREQAETHLYASIIQGDSGKIIGTAMLFGFDHEAKHAEIGYVFHKDYWNRGYATEAIRLIERFAFKDLGLHKLHARVVDANQASSIVLEKNAFLLEGRFKDYYFIDGCYQDGLFYGKIAKLETVNE